MGKRDCSFNALGPPRAAKLPTCTRNSSDCIKNFSAHVIISEIGIDMSRFPSATHLISWAWLCPRNDESADKRRSNRVREGAVWLKTTPVQCAWAAVKKKDSYLQAQFFRITARWGKKKAI